MVADPHPEIRDTMAKMRRQDGAQSRATTAMYGVLIGLLLLTLLVLFAAFR